MNVQTTINDTTLYGKLVRRGLIHKLEEHLDYIANFRLLSDEFKEQFYYRVTNHLQVVAFDLYGSASHEELLKLTETVITNHLRRRLVHDISNRETQKRGIRDDRRAIIALAAAYGFTSPAPDFIDAVIAEASVL